MTYSLPHRAFRFSMRAFEKTLKDVSNDLYYKAAADLAQNLDMVYRVETAKGPILIHCNSETVRIRAREMLRREPDTLEWINGFDADDVLWDIGSNIGVFTLYAAVVAGARVVAIDPLPFNYAGLVKNVSLNRLHDRVMAFCAAVSDRKQVARLHVSNEADTPGGANCPFGQELDNYGQHVHSVYEQACLGYSIDTFLADFDVPFPNHIKIDIDGLPDPVIAGARETLRDPRLRSLMVELQPTKIVRNRESYDFVVGELAAAGLEPAKSARTTPNVDLDPERHATNNFFARVR